MQVNKETLQLIAGVIRKNGSIDLPAQGNSMYPFIREGDICRFVPCDGSPLKKGDIVLFHALTGHLIAHRFYHLKTMNNRSHYMFKGDTNIGPDEPISQDQLIGKLTWIQRGRNILYVTDLAAMVWSKLILAFPVITLVIRMYLNRRET
jgi:signal peptidase I